MQYRLVVSDMDGTLLREDKTVSERTLRAIRRYESAGGRFTVATGRSLEAVERYVKPLGLSTPMVLYNGSVVYDPVAGKELLCRHLATAVAEQVWPILEASGLEIIAHGGGLGKTRVVSEVIAEHMRHDGVDLEVLPDLTAGNAGNLIKIVTIGTTSQMDRAEEAILAAGIPVRLVRSGSVYFEILPLEGGKGSGLKALLEHLQLPRENALAVGDFLNDLDLLATAGLGVAMANAHPDLKQVADLWTGSNEEDGVAQVLEALVEGRPVGVKPMAAAD